MGRLDKDLIKDQKYHFRYYRPSQNHPFLVALVKENVGEDGKIYLSGFNVTHSFIMFKRIRTIISRFKIQTQMMTLIVLYKKQESKISH